jgi:hypothetical protein
MAAQRADIGGDHARIGGERARRAAQGDAAILEDRAVLGKAQRGASVLLDDEDGEARAEQGAERARRLAAPYLIL